MKPAPVTDDLNWDVIRASVLPVWEDSERRGAALLFAIPVFGTILLLGTFFTISQTIVPTLIVIVAAAMATIYVVLGRRRLRNGRARIVRGNLVKKYVHTSTSSSQNHSIRHYFRIKIEKVWELARSGEVEEATVNGETEDFQTTTEIYEKAAQGENLSVVAMPHDGAIYFLIRPQGGILPWVDRVHPVGDINQ